MEGKRMTSIERLKKIIDERMKDNETNIIAVHLMRQYTNARLNCDGSGNIKTCTYGGVDRTLCSSAAIKNGQKEYLRRNYKNLDIGIDTRRIGELVLAEYLRDYYKKETGVELSDDNEDKISLILKNIFKDGNDDSGKSCEKKGRKSDANDITITTKESNRYSANEIKCIADTFVEFFKTLDDFSNKTKWTGFKEEVISRIGELHNCGHFICLFGRMSTCFIKTIESSIAVANAFGVIKKSYDSIYQSRREFVFGNKYDPDKNPGAANLFDIDIDSPLLIEEYSIDVNQMIENEMKYNGIETREEAREIAREIIGIYVEAIFRSNPTGGQKTNSSTPLPELMYVTFSKGGNTYGNYFVTPVRNPSDAINIFTKKIIPQNYEGVGKDKKMLFLSPLYFDRKEEFGITDDIVDTTKSNNDIINFVKDNI
jgi:hypothetical protein